MSKFTPETIDKLCTFLETNPLRTKACVHAQIAHTTFLDWEKNDAEFRDRIKKSEEIGWKFLHDDCVTTIWKTNAWQARAWLLERKFHDIYSLRTKSELSGYIESSETDQERRQRLTKLKGYLNEVDFPVKAKKERERVPA